MSFTASLADLGLDYLDQIWLRLPLAGLVIGLLLEGFSAVLGRRLTRWFGWIFKPPLAPLMGVLMGIILAVSATLLGPFQDWHALLPGVVIGLPASQIQARRAPARGRAAQKQTARRRSRPAQYTR